MKITNQSTLNSKITLPDDTQEDVETLSNESNTEDMTTSFLKVKSSNKTFAKPTEEVEQTITLTNNSEYPITDVSIVDTISTGATFKAGSVFIDDTPYEDYDITTGIALLADIEPSDEVVIKYTMIINEDPTQQTVTNTAQVTYSVNEITDLQENTNIVTVTLVNNKLSVVKTSDKSAVISGQTLTYTIQITNDGDVANTDLVLTDPLPEGVTFVTDSVKIDNVETPGVSPVTGITLPDLNVGGQIVVSFDVTVN